MGYHKLSKSGHCACLGPPLCLTEQSSNAFTTIVLAMCLLKDLVAFSQPDHSWYTSSKERLWKGGRNKRKNHTEQAQRCQA